MIKNLCIGVAAAVLCGALTLSGQTANSAESLLQAATKRELVDGDLAGAIAGYKKALAAAKGNRAVAAQALLQLGQCYRKQGNAEARLTFERLLREYGDQAAAVARAREELAALPASADKPRFRKVRVPVLQRQPRFGTQLSPDGTRLAYYSGNAIWAVPVPGKVETDTAGEPVKLTDPNPPGGAWGMGLTWSGDGKWIAFNAGKEAEEIYVVSSAGGNYRRIATSMRGHAYEHNLSLSPDGQVLAFTAVENEIPHVNTVPVAGGNPTRLTEANTREPAFSPDGRRLAYVRLFPRQPDGSRRGEIRVIPAGGGDSVLVTQIPMRARSPMWSPDGKMLAFLLEPEGHNGSKELWVAPVSAEGRATAPPTSIQLPSETFEPVAGWSAANRISLIINTPELTGIYTVPASGGNATQVTPVTPDYSAYEPRWSPDGKTIWFRVGYPPALGFVPAGGGKISTMLAGSIKDGKLELHEFIESIPGGGNAVSPDGKLVVFAGGRRPYTAGPYLWTIPVAGGEPVQLTKDPGGFPCWFPDGRTVAFYRDNAIYTIPATGGELTRITSASEAVQRAGIACSPDGKSVAYFGEDRTLRVKPVSGGEARIVTKVVGFVWAHNEISWSPDGNRIAYSAGPKIWIVSSDGGTPAELRTGLGLVARHTNLAWSPVGERIAFTAVEGNDPELWLMEDFLPLVQARR